MFPSSSSLNGHPGRPGKRAAGGRGRPGARGPGRGPTVVWAQPGCLGAFSSQAALRSLSEIGSSLTSVSVTKRTQPVLLRAACALADPAPTAEGPRIPAPPGPPCDRRPLVLPREGAGRALDLRLLPLLPAGQPAPALGMTTPYPNGDLNVPSGITDDATMERTNPVAGVAAVPPPAP